MNNAYMIQRVNSASATSSCEPVTNAVVIYEDNATHAWAEQALAKCAGRRGAWKTTWWRLSDLDQPGVLAGAVSRAMHAHLIIVAVRSSGNFPLPFYIWAKSWVPHRLSRGTLLGLIGSNDENRAKDYLLGLGRQAGLRVSIEERNLAKEPAVTPSRNGSAKPAAANRNGNGLVLAQ